MGAKAADGSQPLCPLDLKVTDDEPSRGSRKVDPRSYLSRSFGIRVQVVRANRDGDDHDTEDVEPPPHRGDHEVERMLEGESEHYEPRDDEWRCDPDGD